MKHKNLTTRQIAMIGLLTALVYVASILSIPVGTSRIHLGNSMILLAGFLAGGLPGGLAGGLGSLLYDITFYGANPVSCLVTFVSKFLMGFVAGVVFVKGKPQSGDKKTHFAKTSGRLVLSGILGEAAYIVCYLLKKFITYRYVMGTDLSATMIVVYESLGASLINAVIAIFLSTVLYQAAAPVLQRAGLSYHAE